MVISIKVFYHVYVQKQMIVNCSFLCSKLNPLKKDLTPLRKILEGLLHHVKTTILCVFDPFQNYQDQLTLFRTNLAEVKEWLVEANIKLQTSERLSKEELVSEEEKQLYQVNNFTFVFLLL